MNLQKDIAESSIRSTLATLASIVYKTDRQFDLNRGCTLILDLMSDDINFNCEEVLLYLIDILDECYHDII